MNINSLRYNNINNQANSTITNFIDNYNQLNIFRAIISPILTRTSSLSPAGSIVSALYHKLKHSLVLQRMGEIIARNMMS